MTGAEQQEHVVLLDERGRPRGTRAKSVVHDGATPLHLAFSCYVLDRDGRVLLTQRAATKRTWPGTWTNACCGHPQLDESIVDAVRRRVREELGIELDTVEVALPDFTYRAAMDDGTVEHELCPVLVARTGGVPTPDPDEVDDLEWVAWDELVERATGRPGSLSPWAVAQIVRLAELAPSPAAWLDSGADRVRWVPVAPGGTDAPLLDSGTGEPDASAALVPVLRPVERVLRTFLAERVAELVAIDDVLGEVAGAVEGLVEAGGKRLRPAFVLWGHLAAEGEDEALAVGAGAAIELLHTFALLHDDVMDRSATRRGRPAAHVALTRADARDPAWFGTSGAILAGDLAHVWADQLFDSLPCPPAHAARARAIYTLLRAEVIAGQYLDLHLAESASPVDEDALRVALLKTARYSVTRPLQLGAALAGGDEALGSTLAAYGDAVGLVFQLRDDVLGLFGDPAATGKGCLDDLREGKQTLLVIRASSLADEPDRRELRALLGDRDLDEAGAATCRRIVASSGALASVEARIAAEHARAIAAVADLPARAAAALTMLADLAAFRTR